MTIHSMRTSRINLFSEKDLFDFAMFCNYSIDSRVANYLFRNDQHYHFGRCPYIRYRFKLSINNIYSSINLISQIRHVNHLFFIFGIVKFKPIDDFIIYFIAILLIWILLINFQDLHRFYFTLLILVCETISYIGFHFGTFSYCY